jgi:hypothetical protein
MASPSNNLKITPFVVPPDFRAAFDSFKAEVFYDLNCHQLGEIVSFDAATQTASIQLMVDIQNADAVYRYPVLTNCPVFVLSGGNGCITMPVAAGDSCLVLFNDRDIDNWYENGTESVPNSPRTHDLSDGLALVGFRNLSNKIFGYDPTELQIRNGTGKIAITADEGKVKMSNDVGSLLNAMNKIILALTALNTVKSGGSAATQIATAQSAVTDILA